MIFFHTYYINIKFFKWKIHIKPCQEKTIPFGHWQKCNPWILCKNAQRKITAALYIVVHICIVWITSKEYGTSVFINFKNGGVYHRCISLCHCLCFINQSFLISYLGSGTEYLSSAYIKIPMHIIWKNGKFWSKKFN